MRVNLLTIFFGILDKIYYIPKINRLLVKADGTWNRYSQSAYMISKKLHDKKKSQALQVHIMDTYLMEAQPISFVTNQHFKTLKSDVPKNIPWADLRRTENYAHRLIEQRDKTKNNDTMTKELGHELLNQVHQVETEKHLEKIHEGKENNLSSLENHYQIIKDENIIENDLQNSHDSAVNQQIKKFVNIMRNDNTSWGVGKQQLPNGKVYNDLKTYIETKIKMSEVDKIKGNDALDNLDSIYHINEDKNKNDVHYPPSYMHYLDIDKKDLLSLVYNRKNLLTSDEQQSNLKEALLDALIEGKDKCLSGQCARFVGSLAGIDSNEEIANGFGSQDYIRLSAQKEAHEILNNYIDRFSNQDDHRYFGIAKSMKDVTYAFEDEKLEAEFKNDIKKDVNAQLDSKYKGLLPDTAYIKLRADCNIAIDSI